jgi:SAM-dependent methyltransferase
MNPVSWAVESVSSRGVVQTLKVAAGVVMDLGFDLRYGTDTMRWVDLKSLDIKSANKTLGARYRATKARPLSKLMAKLDLPKDGVFVDLGSGKGRALLIAAQFGFQKIVGVEFSRELCRIASENVRAFARRTGVMVRIDIVESDVANYCLQNDQNIFFMNNPFYGVVLDGVLDKMRESVTRFPRKIWLIYNNPLCHEAVDKTELFLSRKKFEIGGAEFFVYCN